MQHLQARFYNFARKILCQFATVKDSAHAGGFLRKRNFTIFAIFPRLCAPAAG